MNEIKLSDLLAALGDKVRSCRLPLDTQIKQISGDSRLVGANGLFFGCGAGENFIVSARQKGAWCAGKGKGCDIELTDPVEALQVALKMAYSMDANVLRLFGVTGTNGKTTTAFCLQHLLGICGLLGTIKYDCGNGFEASSWTTPPEEKLFELFNSMRQNSLDKCAMELSSHALDQRRAGAFKFEGAIFTNLTQDHLDYHGNLESYFVAKKRLFFELLDPKGFAVINIDDQYGQLLAQELDQVGRRVLTTGSTKRAQYPYKIIKERTDGTVFELDRQIWRTNLIGEYNVANLSGALLTAIFAGVPSCELHERLSLPIVVPGRLEKLECAHRATVWIDYAHTSDAIEKAASVLKKTCPGRLLVVFGAGGDRDRGKRPLMGSAAAKYANKIFLTSDNPRMEDPESIIDMIEQGIRRGCDYMRITDRKIAICQAIKESKENDWILIAGKGHEDYQEVGNVKSHFSDSEVVQEEWMRDA